VNASVPWVTRAVVGVRGRGPARSSARAPVGSRGAAGLRLCHLPTCRVKCSMAAVRMRWGLPRAVVSWSGGPAGCAAWLWPGHAVQYCGVCAGSGGASHCRPLLVWELPVRSRALSPECAGKHGRQASSYRSQCRAPRVLLPRCPAALGLECWTASCKACGGCFTLVVGAACCIKARCGRGALRRCVGLWGARSEAGFGVLVAW